MEPKCPKCGFVMCQQFDDKKVNEHASVAIPNGSYICYRCKITKTPQGGYRCQVTSR